MRYRVERIAVVRDVESLNWDGETVTESDVDCDGIAKRLNEIGEEGWRLVAVERVSVPMARGERVFIFERPEKVDPEPNRLMEGPR